MLILWLVLPNCWCPISTVLSTTILKMELSPQISHPTPPGGSLAICLTSNCFPFLPACFPSYLQLHSPYFLPTYFRSQDFPLPVSSVLAHGISSLALGDVAFSAAYNYALISAIIKQKSIHNPLFPATMSSFFPSIAHSLKVSCSFITYIPLISPKGD